MITIINKEEYTNSKEGKGALQTKKDGKSSV